MVIAVNSIHLRIVAILLLCGIKLAIGPQPVAAQFGNIKLYDGKVTPITEPPCSYCSTQHLKSLIRGDDRVIAWLRANHNGGAFPIRHFLSGPEDEFFFTLSGMLIVDIEGAESVELMPQQGFVVPKGGLH